MESMEELCEAAEIALGYVSDAMEALKGFEDLKDHFDALDNISYELFRSKEHYETEATVMHNEEMAEAVRDYHGGLM